MIHKPSILLTGGSGLLAVNWFYFKRNEYNIYLGLNERQIQVHNHNKSKKMLLFSLIKNIKLNFFL